jgi:hypothetical protein
MSCVCGAIGALLAALACVCGCSTDPPQPIATTDRAATDAIETAITKLRTFFIMTSGEV